HTYAASIDAVLAMLADAEATAAKYESMGHRDVEIIDCSHIDGTLHVESSRVVDVDLPGFAKKVLKPTNTMHQNDEWHEVGDGSWEGVFGVEVVGAPIQLSGVMRLVPGDDTCTHDVTITMNVKVPLVGGKIADWAGKNDVKRTLDAEFAFGDRWLAEHPG
ncbi:MAG: DUF2505 domain-containing protein, partial [Acidimicrobiales bacterium]